MGRPRQHPHPVIGTRYGDVVVTGPAFQEPRGTYKDRPVIVWRVPCTCLLCNGELCPIWSNLHRGLVTRCNSCRHAANGERLKTDAARLADLRPGISDRYPWYTGAPYVYAVYYEEFSSLKIGFSQRKPSAVRGRADIRFRRYLSQPDAVGRWLWQQTPATLADEAVLQGVFTRLYGSAFTSKSQHINEWVNSPEESIAVDRLNATWEFIRSLT
jgi:hypothetical protein